jgi:hypothetical protein
MKSASLSVSTSCSLRFSHAGGVGPTDCHTALSWDDLVEVDLAVTKGAVLEAQLIQLWEKSLMLAGLTSVVILQEDTLARGNAGGEVTAAVPTVDVIVID